MEESLSKSEKIKRKVLKIIKHLNKKSTPKNNTKPPSEDDWWLETNIY